MARPETIANLSVDDTRVLVATFQTMQFAGNGALYGIVAQVAAIPSVVVVQESYGNVQVYRVMIDYELEAALAKAQQSWDRQSKRYNLTLEEFHKLEGWEQRLCNSWAQDNGYAERPTLGD